LSVFKKPTWNHIFHQFSLGLVKVCLKLFLFYHHQSFFFKGASADWWNHMHYQHHSKPNIIDKDPDTRIEPLFLLGKTIPIRVRVFFFFF